MTEAEVKKSGNKIVIKMYLILKQIYGKQYALDSIKECPAFKY